jgi:hypothetical protein
METNAHDTEDTIKENSWAGIVWPFKMKLQTQVIITQIKLANACFMGF